MKANIPHGCRSQWLSERLAADSHTGAEMNGMVTAHIASTDTRPANCAPRKPCRRLPRPWLTATSTTTASGTVHTQWWYQEKGETKQELIPASASAAELLRCFIAVRSARQVKMKTTTTAASQIQPPSMPQARTITERIDCAPGLVCSPTREDLKIASVQKSAASGMVTKPMATVTANVRMAMIACHQRFWKSKTRPI